MCLLPLDAPVFVIYTINNRLLLCLVHFLVTSFYSCADTGSRLFVEAIEQAIDDMKELLESQTT